MVDGCHIENHVLAISRQFIATVKQNLVRRSMIMFRYKSSDQNTKFRKFKMADGRHFENGLIAISQPRIIRFQ